jgi:hypothetical protein
MQTQAKITMPFITILLSFHVLVCSTSGSTTSTARRCARPFGAACRFPSDSRGKRHPTSVRGSCCIGRNRYIVALLAPYAPYHLQPKHRDLARFVSPSLLEVSARHTPLIVIAAAWVLSVSNLVHAQPRLSACALLVAFPLLLVQAFAAPGI